MATTDVALRKAALLRNRPTRTGKVGTIGRPLDIYTNNFEILNFPEGVWYHYADISAPSDSASPAFRRDERNQRVIQHLKLNDIRFGEGVYDGKAIYFSRSELGAVLEIPNVFSSQRPINVTFTKIQVVDFSILQKFANGQSDLGDRGQVAVNMLNILLRETPSQRQGTDQSIVVKRRAIYSTANLRNIRGGLQVADGFIQSVRPGSPRMVVNVNYTNGVTWQPGHLFDLLKEILRMRNWNFPRMLEADTIRGDQIREINKLIKGIKVMAPHLEGRSGKRRRPLVISGLHSKSAQTYRFDCNLGHVSVAQYFQMQYNRTLHHPTMCLISIRSNDEILFPIETLMVLPGQLVSKSVKLLPSQVSEVQRVAQDMKPSPRLKSITESLRSNQVLAYENAPVLVSSNFRIDLRPMISKARLLPPPDVLYRGNARPTIARGAWNMMRLKVWQSPQPVEKWAICVISPRCDRSTAGNFGRTLVGICAEMGIPLNPNFQVFEGQHPMDALAHCAPANFVLCILNGQETSHKEAIKKWGDIEHGIPTQVILWDKISERNGGLSRKLDQYCRNLALKINAKLGGINCIPPSMPGLVLNSTIIMGLDVSHPNPGALGPSVAALASSVDPACSFYIGQSQVQRPRQEAIDNLQGMITHALRQQFMYVTRGLGKQYVPTTQVLIFRDGVSEGQFMDIIEFEVIQVKEGITAWLAELKKNANITIPMPRLTFVVVGKRHHFRMFEPRDHQPNHTRVENCQSGTVIDRHVTNPYWDDYYLLSHAALLGTSRPAHYSVLWDETGFTADQLQQISFHLCHLYSRATRAVSIPAPVYYADQICARWRYHHFPQTDDPSASDELEGVEDEVAWYRARWRPVHPRIAVKMYWM